MPCREIDVAQAGVSLRQLRGNGERALAMVAGSLQPGAALALLLKPDGVCHSHGSVGWCVIAVHVNGALELGDGILDVLEILVLLQVAAATQVKVVSGGSRIRTRPQRLLPEGLHRSEERRVGKGV